MNHTSEYEARLRDQEWDKAEDRRLARKAALESDYKGIHLATPAADESDLAMIDRIDTALRDQKEDKP